MSTIDFNPFVNAPRMRRFTVARYAADVHYAFCTMRDPKGAQRIALGAVMSGQGHEPAALLRPDQQYPVLPIHLRMLEIDLDREADGTVYLVDDEGTHLDKVEADVILDSFVKGDGGTLEGLVLCLPGNMFGEDDASGLGEHIELLEPTLPQFVNLTQLCVRARGFEAESYAAAAERLALAIPSSQYISVRMSNDHMDLLNLNDDRDYRKIYRNSDGTVRLERLEGPRENEEVELYKVSLYKRAGER